MSRIASWVVAFGAVASVTLGGCGGGSGGGSDTSVGVGTITITGFSPNPVPASPTAFTITGTNFETVTGTTAIVTFVALGGATPFDFGSESTAQVIGSVLNDTTIVGTTPRATLCGTGDVFFQVIVTLESGVTSAPFDAGGTLKFAAPTVTSITGTVGNTVPALVPSPITVNGTNFSPVGGTVRIRMTGDANAHNFADGTENTVEVVGSITSSTTISATSPKSTNPVNQGSGILAVSQDIQGASVQVFFDETGSCTDVSAPGAILFDRPDATFVPASVPQTIPTAFTITSTGGTNVWSPGAGGATTAVRFVDTSGVGPNAFQGGTQTWAEVAGPIVSSILITGTTPTAFKPTSFSSVVRVVFEDGTVMPVTGPTFNAPPIVANVTNNETAPNGVRVPLATTRTFSAAAFSPMLISGSNFVAGASVAIFDQAVGPTKPIGGGILQNLITTIAVTPTTIVGDAPIDPNQSGFLQAAVRVTNPDGQIGEFTAGGADPLRFGTQIDFLDRNCTVEAGTNSESSLAINPTNPLHMVTLQHTFVGGIEMRLGRSLDGGRTWTQTRIDGATAGGDGLAAVNRVDPRCAYDRFGNLYIVYFTVPQLNYPNTPPRNMICVRSTDDGATFSSVVVATDPTTAMDRDFLCTGVDGSNAAREAIYIGWRDGGTFGGAGDKIVVAAGFSTALGAFGAFAAPVAATHSPTRGHQLAYGSVAANGDLYVCWYDYTGAPGSGLPALSIVMDVDPLGAFAGATFTTDILVAPTNQGFFELPPSDPTRGDGPNPEMTVHRAGPYAGRAILVWGDEVPPSGGTGNLDILSRFTDTAGLSFGAVSSPTGFTGNDQYMASVQVDRTTGAVVYATWYDSRNAGGANDTVQRFATASYDGGATWLTAVPISDASSAPALDGFDWGDYEGMDVFGNYGVAVFADTSNSTGDHVGASPGNPENHVSRFQIR